MSENLNHECIICGTRYHYCDDCGKMKSFTPHRTITDTAEHYQIFLIIKEFQNNIINKNEAKIQLQNINISRNSIINFKDSVKKVLLEILSDENKKDNFKSVKYKGRR